MKRYWMVFLLFAFVFVSPATVFADQASDFIKQGDSMCSVNLSDGCLQAASLYLKAVQADPNNYEANWKIAKAYRIYIEARRDVLAPDWEKISAKYGKEGMKYGAKAINISPNKPEGYFWYGVCVGSYADGVSILTALKEGLKNKTQDSFEKVYSIDKAYYEYKGILALGRFWQVLPWPLSDKKKSRQFLTEFNKVNPNNIEGQVYLGELLKDSKDAKEKAEAKALLTQAASSNNLYFKKLATDFLKDMK